jgi:hypothetical protein
MSSQQETVNSIQKLQEMEKHLQSEYNVLSPKDKIANLAKIKELSQMRLDLFNVLKANYSRDIADSKSDLDNQIATLRIVEEQLRDAKKTMQGIKQQHTNKMRMVEFATYFSEKYKAYNQLFLLILKWVVIIGILIYIGNLDFVPEKYSSKQNTNNLFLIIITAVSLYALYKILFMVYDIVTRDNMNFNEYDFGGDTAIDMAINKTKLMEYDENQFEKLAEDIHLGCVDSSCCADGTMYDDIKKKCIPVMKAVKEANNIAALTKSSFESPTASSASASGSSKSTAEPFTNNIVPFASV